MPAHTLTSQRFPVGQNCRVPSRAGDSINIKNLHFNSLNDRLPSRADCLINQIFKNYIEIQSSRSGESHSFILPTDWAPALYIFPLPSYILLLTSYIIPLTSSQYSYYGVVISLTSIRISLATICIRLIPDTSHLQPVTPIYTRLSSGGSLSVTLPLHFPNTSPCSTVFSIPRYLSSDSHSWGGLGEVLGKSFTNTSPLAPPFCTAFPRDLGKWGGLFQNFIFSKLAFLCRKAKFRSSYCVIL